jgi:hypothetical protein
MDSSPAIELTYEQRLELQTLPDRIVGLLQDPLNALGFTLDIISGDDPDGTSFKYYYCPSNKGRVVFLYAPNIDRQSRDCDSYMRALAFLFGKRAMRLFLFSNVSNIYPVYSAIVTVLVNSNIFERAGLFSSFDIGILEKAKHDLGLSKEKMEVYFVGGLAPQSNGGGATPSEPCIIDAATTDKLVLMLAKQANSSGIGAKGFLKDFVRRMQLPEKWELMRADNWKGDALADARDLIEWSCDKEGWPPGEGRDGYTVLGCLLEALLEDVGDSQFLIKIIVEKSLITDPTVLESLKTRLKP